VVDDNATSRQILQDILESFSFVVSLAASGEDALEEIERADTHHPFELVLMDWKMPGMDGIEASKRIKTHNALNKIPAIILVTAYGREELMQQADEIGLEGFLLKPVNSSILFDAIMQALGKEDHDVSRVGRKKEQGAEEFSAIYGARVLLVEDNEINQQVALEILQGAGLSVTVANNGQEGVDAARQNQYDAILMDIQMPVMDGYTAARRIRTWEGGMRKAEVGGQKTDDRGQIADAKRQIIDDGEQKTPVESRQGGSASRNSTGQAEDGTQASSIQHQVPIIAMTAHAMTGDEQKSIAAGMNDHVTKPIDPDQLFATLQKWIRPVAERSVVPKSLPASGGPPILDAPPEPDPEMPDEDELPEFLPGFDLHAGLARLMGNKRLYRKLLLNFAADYRGVTNQIRETLDRKDFERAHGIVHNLKGMSGNLAAAELQEAAEKMERLVKGESKKTVSEKELDGKMAELENALQRAFDAIQTLGPAAQERTIDSSEDEEITVPMEIANEAVGRIEAAAEMGDVMQIKSIAEELKSKADSMVPFCEKLIQLAEDFDFDGIHRFVHELDR
jgi:CheY-like chemotaxis protein